MRKQSERKAQGLKVVEGEKEIRQALMRCYPDSVFFCHEIATDKALVEQCTAACPVENLFFITKDVFAKVAYRDDSGGIILLGKACYLHLNDINTSSKSIGVILENVEKPGNLGAVLRTL
jgi:TrmH family RNA methyltransferase